MPAHEKKKTKALTERLRENLQLIGSIFLIFGILFGAWGFMESRYAQKKVESKLDYAVFTLSLQSNQDKIAKLMERCPNGIENADPSTKELLKGLMDKTEELKRKIEILEKMGIGMGGI